MIARTVEEDEDAIFVEYPFILYRENTIIVASPYMPLAENGIVAFKKNHLLSTAIAPKYINKRYLKLVDELKEIKFAFKEASEVSDSKQFLENKLNKILH
jgi:hypothetical protein